MDAPPPPWTELPVGPISTRTTYTVIMRNEIFHLSHQQISYDTPNYFTDYFPDDHTRCTLMLDRNPALFALIVDYLSGYAILPLSKRALPPTMDIAVALRNLLLDAQFFGLQGLCDLLMLPNPNVDLVIVGFSNQLISLRNLVQDRLPQSVVYNNGALVSARNKLPVLVFAQDVILRIVIDKVVEAVDEEEVLPHNRTLSFEIDLPSSFMTSAYTDSTCHSYHLATVATSSEPGGIMHIDGIPHDLRHFFSWCAHRNVLRLGSREDAIEKVWSTTLPRVSLTLPRADSVKRKTIREAIMLWVEELLFYIPEQENVMDAARGCVTNARLVSVKARSRRRILNGLISPLLRC